MRNEEYREDGSSLFINNGTNPDADVTVCTLHLTRYLGDHCATIAEALELLKKINVTDDDATNLGWNVCFLMADATGAYGVLEIAQDQVIFSEGCHCQANFYIADKFLNQAKYFDGLGRYTKVMKCIDDVRNLDDFNQLMHSVRYSGIFDDGNDDWDNIGDISADFGQSTQWMLVHRYDEAVLHRRHELMHYFDDWTEEEIADSRMKWNTTYRTLVNCNTLQMTVVCNEDLEQRVLLGF